MKKIKYLDSGAIVSPCGLYRYLLWREWRGSHDPKNWRWLGGVDGKGQPLGEPRACLFVMLNPSTADGGQDDATVRRCVSFAAAWKYERVEIVNLFALRATDPRLLKDASDPVGPDNLSYVRDAADDAGVIVCAWGAHGSHLGQDETVLGWIGRRPRYALGLTLTGQGQPRHPLYMPTSSPLVPFREDAR